MIFLALVVDFKEIGAIVEGLFGGPFELEFVDIYRAWSMIRYDSALGILCNVLAVLSLIFFSTLLLLFVEKHMRIGKRTMSGIPEQLDNHLASFLLYILLTVFVYELWALVLSAMLYMICSIASKTVARILFVVVSFLFVATLIYLLTICYLWLPCKLQTGFRAYDAFLYSYRLVVGVRWRLYLSMMISYAVCFIILVASSIGPIWISRILAIILYSLCYLSYFIRMETLYFETDKLDREDILRSYREL